MAGTAAKSAITLKGSAEIVAEFFHYGVNSILYQRGIFPPETFSRVQKYGLTLLVSTNDEIKKYLANIVTQIKVWLMKKCVQKLVVVISSVDTGEVLERWDFNIEYDQTITDKSTGKDKDVNEIHKEIGAVIRQITASVTFLPLLDCLCQFTGLREDLSYWGKCRDLLTSSLCSVPGVHKILGSFDLHIYTDKNLQTDEEWSDTPAGFIANSQEVRLRSFSTSVHHIEASVSYRNMD